MAYTNKRSLTLGILQMQWLKTTKWAFVCFEPTYMAPDKAVWVLTCPVKFSKSWDFPQSLKSSGVYSSENASKVLTHLCFRSKLNDSIFGEDLGKESYVELLSREAQKGLSSNTHAKLYYFGYQSCYNAITHLESESGGSYLLFYSTLRQKQFTIKFTKQFTIKN